MRFFFVLILLAQGAAMGAEPPTARAAAEPSCRSSALGYESNEVVCTLPASAGERRWRLVVNFAGGHDDTIASLVVRLSDTPDPCDADSKLRLMGEDGNVSLACSFTAPAAAGREVVLTAVIAWSHAQYVDYTLTPR